MTPVTPTMRRHWWQALTLALAGGYVVTGVLSPTPAIRWPFVVGAVLVAGAHVAATRSRAAAGTALVIGALTPVATTWWSVVSPVTALLILACGTASIRATTTASPVMKRNR